MKIPAHEELLLARCHRQEPEAIQALADLYGKSVYGFIQSILGNQPEAAKRLMLDTFIEAVREIAPFNMEEPFMVTIMRKLISDLGHRFKTEKEAHLLGLDQRRRMIFSALSKLSWQEKILILLRDQMDFDFDEMEAVLGHSSRILKNQLKEARLHFRDGLDFLLQKAEHR